MKGERGSKEKKTKKSEKIRNLELFIKAEVMPEPLYGGKS
jgi:hypothetical protein